MMGDDHPLRPIPNAPDDTSAPDASPTRYDLDTERALLGAAMFDEDAATIASALPAAAWYSPAHQTVAATVGWLLEAGQPVTVETVWARLVAEGRDSEIGGHQVLLDALATAPAPASAQYLAEALTDQLDRRLIIAGAARAIDEALHGSTATAREHCSEVVDAIGTSGTIGDVKELAPLYLDLLMRRESGEEQGIATGMVDLDELTGGLHRGNLVYLGARTGMGKTATLCTLTLNLLKAGQRVLFVSLEMPWKELFDRWVGNLARINTRRLRRGEIGDAWPAVTAAIDQLVATGLRASHPAPYTVPAIRAEARLHKADVVIVDYLQLVQAVGRRNNNRENEVAEVSRSLKTLALTLDVPIVAACQLNRNIEHRIPKKPELSDLRDSGQLEQDGDVIVMAYRPVVYDDEADPADIELLVRKNRHGERGEAHMTFLLPFQAVVDRPPESRLRSA